MSSLKWFGGLDPAAPAAPSIPGALGLKAYLGRLEACCGARARERARLPPHAPLEGARALGNGDLSGWDVGQATSMNGMFSGATSFNGDLSSWDVGRVEDMTGMFSGASSFNADISSWPLIFSVPGTMHAGIPTLPLRKPFLQRCGLRRHLGLGYPGIHTVPTGGYPKGRDRHRPPSLVMSPRQKHS